MSYFLGIDLGTSYFKAGVFDEYGYLKGLGRQLIKKETKDKICELQVPIFWSTLHTCVEQAIRAACISVNELCSVSYSSQANSFILLNGAGHPLTPFVLWSDKRAEGMNMPLDLLAGGGGFQEKTGLGISPGPEFAVAKINWYQKMQPRLWKHVKHILSISDYLIFSLTGQKAGDLSTASLTGLLDVPKGRWWNQALDVCNLRAEYLPLLLRTGTFVGPLTTMGAQHLGLLPGTLFFTGGLDHHVAALGAGVTCFNYLSESTGTVLACAGYREGYFPKMGVSLSPGPEEGRFFQMAFDDNGAVTLEWYLDHYAPDMNIPALLEMAARVEPGCDGLVARPCAHRFPGLDGFENVKSQHRHGHFVRAILKSTARSLSNIVGKLTGDSPPIGIVPTGGGAQSLLWIQLKADLLQTDFLIPECNELACKGAAMIAAAGAKYSGNVDGIVRNWARTMEKIESIHS